jgi:UDP-3-O-[3-hydroxymyristoyl] glucosamine N-acyltransferase
MLIENNKPIKLIGYPESSLTDGCLYHTIFSGTKNKIDIIVPEKFLKLNNKFDYQYFIAFSLDMNLRKLVCDEIDNLELDCLTYIDDTCVVFNNSKIGKGVGIGPFSTVLYDSTIKNHCFIESNCLIAHHVELGKNSIVHAGTLIAGRTNIGENCTFGFKSSIINNVNVTNNVSLGAFSNITKDITKSGRYVGSIARYMGE